MDQSASSVLLIEPLSFGRNPDSARTNAFMRALPEGASSEEIRSRAIRELRLLVERLSEEGVEALLWQESGESSSPDAIFPNNWVTFHEDGTAILYPMEPPSRRRERRPEVLSWLQDEHRFRIREVVDLSHHENEGRYLEGTGSMVFDRPGGIVYASISPRTTPSLLEEYAESFGLQVVRFRSFDAEGVPIYHTNVVLAVGTEIAVVCGDAIADEAERRSVARSLQESGRELIEITMEQLYSFAGNLLEVRDRRGDPVLSMSERALEALDPAQIRRMERHARLVSSPIPTIEDYGGGSVRCMMAEVFLPRAI